MWKKACKKQHFFRRCFSIKEREFIGDNYRQAAGNWAVKEAVSKSFGTGILDFELRHIEVFRDDLGKPYVSISEKAKEIKDRLGITHIHVSISNTDDLVMAYVVAEKRDDI